MEPSVVDSKPPNFFPKLVATSLHLEFNDRFLVLKKAPGMWSENLWGIPCGRQEGNETIFQTIQRESLEEIGLHKSLKAFRYIAPLYVLYPDYSYVFHMFYLKLENEITVQLSPEHVEHRWLKAEEFDLLPLIPGQKEALRLFLSHKNHLDKSIS